MYKYTLPSPFALPSVVVGLNPVAVILTVQFVDVELSLNLSVLVNVPPTPYPVTTGDLTNQSYVLSHFFTINHFGLNPQ